MSKATTPILDGTRHASADSLLREAMKHPGVCDLIRVWQVWQRFDHEVSELRRATSPRIITWVSGGTTANR
ncbi:MAG: hypothetical protein KJZ68_13930 [Phycisphaerales bacterium]|nr:hypothetical protein [Phycisphaerales bacterium]